MSESQSRSRSYLYGRPLPRSQSKQKEEESTDPGSILMDYSNDNQTSTKTDSSAYDENDDGKDNLVLENSYLMDVVGEDSGDTILGGLSTSLLSSESQMDLTNSSNPLSSSVALLGNKLSSQEKIIKRNTENKHADTQKDLTLTLQTPAKDKSTTKQTPTTTSIITSNLLSPFSPLLQPQTCSQTHSQSHNTVAWKPPDSFREGDLSLQPCRKVSVVVHVSYQSNKWNQGGTRDAPDETLNTDTNSK